jgi:hypothetical protein
VAVIPQGGTALYTLTIGGVNSLNRIPLESIRLVNNGANGMSTLEFKHEDPTKAFALPAGAEVIFNDYRASGGAGTVMFGGYLVSRELEPDFGQIGRSVICRCVDYSVLLDRRVRGPYLLAGASDGSDQDGDLIVNAINTTGTTLVVQKASAANGQNGIRNTALGGSPQQFQGMSERAMIEQVMEYAQGATDGQGQGPREYYVDGLKRLWYHKAGQLVNTPPYDISDNPGANQIACSNLQLEYDETGIINSVYVRGDTATHSGWVTDSSSVSTYGLRQAVVDFPRANTLSKAQQYGRGFLQSHKDPLVHGSFEVDGSTCYTADGPPSDTGHGARHWEQDQLFRITNAALSLTTATTWFVRTVETDFQGGSGVHSHRVTFGGLSPSGAGRIARALAQAGVTSLGTVAAPTSGRQIIGTIG